MQFEWATQKALANEIKHGVTFEYATRVFLDRHCIIEDDTRKNYSEARKIALGLIEKRLFIVVFTERLNVVRIISARKGNKREQRKYNAVCA